MVHSTPSWCRKNEICSQVDYRLLHLYGHPLLMEIDKDQRLFAGFSQKFQNFHVFYSMGFEQMVQIVESSEILMLEFYVEASELI